MSARDVTFRPITAADAEFLYAVYASTRAAELAQVDWSESQKEAFLRGQFDAQHQAYQATYPGANFLFVLLRDQAVGRLYLTRRDHEIRSTSPARSRWMLWSPPRPVPPRRSP